MNLTNLKEAAHNKYEAGVLLLADFRDDKKASKLGLRLKWRLLDGETLDSRIENQMKRCELLRNEMNAIKN